MKGKKMAEINKIYTPFAEITNNGITYTISENTLNKDTYLVDLASLKDWDKLYAYYEDNELIGKNRIVEVEEVIEKASLKIKKGIKFTGIIKTVDLNYEGGESYVFVRNGKVDLVEGPSYITNIGQYSFFCWWADYSCRISTEEYVNVVNNKYIVLDSFKNEHGIEMIRYLAQDEIKILPFLAKEDDVFKFFYMTNNDFISVKEYRSQG